MNPIKMFFHCMDCTLDKPFGVSPADYQMIVVGLDTDKNIVIWCERHEKEITTIKKVDLMQSKN